MNDIEAVQYLSLQHALAGRPRRLEEIDKTIPYFEVFKTDTGKHDIRCFNYEGHENAPRMSLWEHYMRTRVFPFVQMAPAGGGGICGFYNIELHDSYTYLDRPRSNYDGCLVFSRFKDHPRAIVVPDPYAQCDWGGALKQVSDPVAWTNKIDKTCFYGTTTGDRDPLRNMRIKACIWALKRPDLYDFKITKVAQMHPSAIIAAHGPDTYANIVGAPVSIAGQMRYKYHLVMDGNTCRFDIWNYLTNTVTLKHESQEMLWYYPLMLDGTHFVEVRLDNIEQKVSQLSKAQCELMIENAKALAVKVSQPLFHNMYLVSLFDAMAANR